MVAFASPGRDVPVPATESWLDEAQLASPRLGRTSSATGPSSNSGAWPPRRLTGASPRCVAAAGATTVVAAVALGAGVPVEISGEQIPVAGSFAQLTLFFTAIGVLIAKALARRAARPRRAFTVTTVAFTALSLVPNVAADAATATKLVLITTHLVAGTIVIPVVAHRLPTHAR